MKLTEPQEIWLQALESDKYTQTSDALHTKDGDYCCIGVLCDVSGLGEWVNPHSCSWTVSYMGESNVAPREVRDWVGLTLSGQGDCIQLNDEGGARFAEIAEIIRETPNDFFGEELIA